MLKVPRQALVGMTADAVVIAGPTASGKSALALEIARRRNGVIINADSMQVYSALWIVTARPSAADLQLADHRLYGHVPALEAWSVARWLAEARSQFEILRSQGRLTIFVGGTGLYITALLEGLSAMPEPDPAVRAHWRKIAVDTPDALHGELVLRDPAAAGKLHPGDRQRLVRALEIFDTTGLPISHFQMAGNRSPVLAKGRIEKHLLLPDRALLHQRINQRFEAMVAAGALEEVAKLAKLHLPPDLPVMKAIGVAQLLACQQGLTTQEQAIALGQAATRQYAKRQSTWFRNQFGAGWQVRA